MGARAELSAGKAMATRWRRRQMCALVSDQISPAAIRTISASGAFLETTARPVLNSAVELRHPEAGAIAGWVDALRLDGVVLRFEDGEHSVAFALSAIAADMSKPA